MFEITGLAILDTFSWDAVSEKLLSYVPRLIVSVILFAIGYVFIRIVDAGLAKIFKRTKFDRTLEIFIQKTSVGILWMIIALIVLSNLGVNVSGIIAGLGIMGFVVGFALKDTLGNFAAGLFILAYKPFRVDDYVDVGGVSGTVKEVGLAACVLRSPDGIKITVPNSEIWGKAIMNYTGNTVRCIRNLNVGIGYGDDIKKAKKIIMDIMKKDSRILPDPVPEVVVIALGDSSVNLSVRPSVKKEDFWAVYFDLIVQIKEMFDKNGISIPFPQRDVHMYQEKKKKR